MKKAAENKALKIGGIALLLWFLLRKAGSSAPIPGPAYGGQTAPEKNLVTWLGMGKPVKVFWNGPSGDLYGYMKPNTSQKDFEDAAPLNKKVTKGQFIGYVNLYDTSAFGVGKGWIKVLINGTTDLRFYKYDFTRGANNPIVTARI